MKTRSISLLILAAALSASALVPVSAASRNDLPIGYSVSRINLASCGNELIARGDTQTRVLRLMGSRFREVSPDVWLYHGYQADLDLANEQGCDTMVITFAQGKVADLKLVNMPAVSIVAANSKAKPAEHYASLK